MTISDEKNEGLEAALGRRGATPDLELDFWREIAAGGGISGKGTRGLPGPTGPVGPEGPMGPAGPKGEKGDPADPQDVINAENRGVFTGTGSLKNLGEGWWYINKDQAGVTGRPSGSAGDLLVYRRQVGTDGVAMLAFGRDKDGPQVWGEYRAADNIGYSPWIKLSVTDTLNLDQIKAELEKEGWGPLPGGGTQPTQLVKYYAGYDTAFPTHLNELTEYNTTKFTITRTDTVAERIFVLVPKVHSSQVSGFIVSGGVEAVWNYRDITIDGVEYRAFYSPGAYYETSDEVEIKFQ